MSDSLEYQRCENCEAIFEIERGQNGECPDCECEYVWRNYKSEFGDFLVVDYLLG